MIASLYRVSQAPTFGFPEVAWTDPDLLRPGRSPADFPLRLAMDAVLTTAIGLSAG